LKYLKISIFLILALFSIYFIAVEPLEKDHPNNADLNISYNSASETINIKVVNGSFYRPKGKIFFGRTDIETNYTLKGYGKTKKTEIWVSSRFDPLDTNRLTKYPVRQGENVQIISDGTDKDKDGVKGIENGENIPIKSIDEDTLYTITIINIENNTATSKALNPVGK
jgi:hypothetical protein